jgi:hypothetical protein
LNNPKLTTRSYKAFLDISFEYLHGNATLANDYNTAQMLLLFFSWRSYYDIQSLNSTAAATFNIAGDPWHTISRHPFNWLLVANDAASVSYTSGTDFFEGYMRYTTYNSTTVSEIAEVMGATQLYDQLQMAINIQSFFVAAAINRGILDFDVLRLTAGVRYDAIPVDFVPYTDPRYPPMDPIYCHRVSGKCVLYMNPWGLDQADVEGAYYPLFESVNVSDTACKCRYSTPTYSDNCNYNLLYIGLGYLGRSASAYFPFKSSFFTTYAGYDTTDQLYYCKLSTLHECLS